MNENTLEEQKEPARGRAPNRTPTKSKNQVQAQSAANNPFSIAKPVAAGVQGLGNSNVEMTSNTNPQFMHAQAREDPIAINVKTLVDYTASKSNLYRGLAMHGKSISHQST